MDINLKNCFISVLDNENGRQKQREYTFLNINVEGESDFGLVTEPREKPAKWIIFIYK